MRLGGRTVGIFAVVVLLGGCWSAPSYTPSKPAVLEAACNGTLVPSTQGTIASNAITELSGLVSSRRTQGVWWGHNDSGDSARIFAFGGNGVDLGTYALSGAVATDWEDIAAGPGPQAETPYLYIADIGDNTRTRSSVRVYRVPEPFVDPSAPTPPQTLTGVDTLTFTYPDGPHDAESLVVDPISGALVIVTKEFSGTSKLFRAPANGASGSTTVLQQVATVTLGTGLAGLATGADVTPAGDVLAIRTYSTVKVFHRVSGSTLESAVYSNSWCLVAGATEPQGEAIGFSGDGTAYVTAGEGAHAALHRFQTP